MFHNKKNVDHQWNSYQSRGRTIQMKIMSTRKTNTMMKQTWVVTKASLHKTSFSLLDQDHMNNDQVQKSREEKTRLIINELIMKRDFSKLPLHKKQDEAIIIHAMRSSEHMNKFHITH
jgi:hypothetical protein